jgi:4-hydroxy-tetrahydrodipicolinate synthase
MQNELSGLGVAMVTPFLENTKVDFDGLEKLTNHLVENGANYLVVQGTTGESPTLTDQEKKDVLKCVIEVNKNRLPIVFGLGGNNTTKLVEAFKTFDLTGVSYLLSVSPYYSKPTQEGILNHYKALSENTKRPIILYNVPGRTGSNMLAATTLKIAEAFKNIVAIKEASGNMDQIMTIIKNKPQGFEVISGDDTITLPLIACGAIGVISVVGNAYPKQFSKMIQLAAANKIEEARKIHYSLMDITNAFFTEGNPAGVKEALQSMGITKNFVRMPLVNVSEKHRTEIIRLVAQINN